MGVMVAVALAVAVPSAQPLRAAEVGGKDVAVPYKKCVEVGLPVLPNYKSGSCPEGSISNDPATGGAIVNYLRQWLILLSGAAGLIILLMIVIAGTQYIISRGDPSNVKSAKERLTNALIAFVLYLMAFAILQFLIPGGVLA